MQLVFFIGRGKQCALHKFRIDENCKVVDSTADGGEDLYWPKS